MSTNWVCGPISEQPEATTLMGSQLGSSSIPTKNEIELPGRLTQFWLDADDPSGSLRRAKVRPSEKVAFTLDQVFTPNECSSLIAASESLPGGFKPAGIGASGKQEVTRHLRDSDRLISLDPALAAIILNRIAVHLPVIFRGRRLIGLNEQVSGTSATSASFPSPRCHICPIQRPHPSVHSSAQVPQVSRGAVLQAASTATSREHSISSITWRMSFPFAES